MKVIIFSILKQLKVSYTILLKWNSKRFKWTVTIYKHFLRFKCTVICIFFLKVEHSTFTRLYGFNWVICCTVCFFNHVCFPATVFQIQPLLTDNFFYFAWFYLLQPRHFSLSLQKGLVMSFLFKKEILSS